MSIFQNDSHDGFETCIYTHCQRKTGAKQNEMSLVEVRQPLEQSNSTKAWHLKVDEVLSALQTHDSRLLLQVPTHRNAVFSVLSLHTLPWHSSGMQHGVLVCNWGIVNKN